MPSNGLYSTPLGPFSWIQAVLDSAVSFQEVPNWYGHESPLKAKVELCPSAII
jgi:hypothetical protein